jgi:hypothetical protein
MIAQVLDESPQKDRFEHWGMEAGVEDPIYRQQRMNGEE